jgi:Ca-activated chloride channel homolog
MCDAKGDTMSGDCSGCDAFGTFGEVDGSWTASQDANGCTRSGPLDLLRRLSLAIAASLPIVTAPGAPSAAMVDWLVLLVDASESIDPHDYRLQRQAYVNVLQDADICLLLEGASIAIVEFATAPHVVVAWTDDPRKAAQAYAGYSRGIQGPGPESLTGIARALGLALDLLEGKAGRKVIDISGDGPDNVDWFLGVWAQRDRARQLRIEINGLAIPTPEEPKIDVYYAENVITGFLEISREHVDFERALLTKMHIEIAGLVPQ